MYVDIDIIVTEVKTYLVLGKAKARATCPNFLNRVHVVVEVINRYTLAL